MQEINYDRIFKYPMVQYIPLEIDNSHFVSVKKRISSILLITDKQEELDPIFSRHNLKPFILEEDELGIYVTNFKILLIRYRGHEVIMVGREKNSTAHLFSITSEYFYKNRLSFILYNPEGERIHIKNFSLKNIK